MIKKDNYGEVNVVKNRNYQYGVMNNAGEMIVPFGKYDWISGFDHGLARVILGNGAINLITGEYIKPKWGIIDESGQEILPLIYDEIWNFTHKGRHSTKVVINGEEKVFDLNSRRIIENQPSSTSWTNSSADAYGTNYGEYAGSYAQDEMGYSDDVINDAFEGDPDAYWNID